jgi:inner membrane protein
MGSTHAMAGFVIWFAMVRANISPPPGIIVVVLGSILPDIDHPNGTLRQMMDLPKFLRQPISAIIPHRGPTHTIWAGIMFSLLTVGLAAWGRNPIQASLWTGLAMLIGYSSHLVLDSLNPTGVKWLRPWKDSKLHGPIRTGSRGEEYFFYGLIGMLFLVAVI